MEKTFYVLNFGGLIYEAYENTREIGEIIGDFLKRYEPDASAEKLIKKIKRVPLGMELVGYFEGHNYISFYKFKKVIHNISEIENLTPEELYDKIGNGEEEPEELNEEEWNRFISGVYDYVKK